MPIVDVTGPGDLERFLRFGEQVHAGNPAWVPPLRHDLTRLLTGRSPLSGITAHACLFEQGGVVVSRAAAFINDHYIRTHGARVGFVGLFDARPGHPEAARAALAAAGDWLAGRGMAAAVAPINGHVLYGFALPVDHFDELPVFPYGGGLSSYPQAFLDAGYDPAYPELTYLIDLGPLDRSALDARCRVGGVRIRSFRPRSFRDDCQTMTRIINDAFAGKWYYATLPLADSLAFWWESRQGIVPGLFLIAEQEGEPAGALLSFPDYSPAVRAMGGRSGPVAVGRFLWHRRRIRQGSIFIVATAPRRQGAGIGGALTARALLEMKSMGYTRTFYHTVTADNLPSRRIAESFGGVVVRTYMGFRKAL